MNKLEYILGKEPYKMVFSKPSKGSRYLKATGDYIDGKYLLDIYENKKVLNRWFDRKELMVEVEKLMSTFNQLNAWSDGFEYSLRKTKKGKFLFFEKKTSSSPVKRISHNRKKKYIFEEGVFVKPLYDMGIMKLDGSIVKSKYNKFKQINRYLEIINDLIKKDDLDSINILEFACGKSYLSFVLYYYLKEIKGLKVTITGVDLNEDTIDFCNNLVHRYEYENMNFFCGDINTYKIHPDTDMILSLHACDTATDTVLYSAVKNDIKYVFAAPCCQHEVFKRIDTKEFELIGGYSIIEERLSALITDNMRADILKACGYRVQVMEFVNITHTPKNLLIRAVRNKNKVDFKKIEEIDRTAKKYNIKHSLIEMIKKLGI